MGRAVSEITAEPRPSRLLKIIAIAVVVALAIALGVAIVMSLPRSSERSDLVHLNNQREIVDNSMNLYNPLVKKFSTRYSNAFTEGAPEDVKLQVFEEETGRIERDSTVAKQRLKEMQSSPALRDGDVAKAFKRFKSAYGAIIDYNDQLVVNLVNVNQSVSGACGSLHKLDILTDDYAEQYLKIAEECLAALDSAKKKSDDHTKTLLTAVEGVVGKQRDAAQKVIDSDDEFDRSIATIYLGLGLLDVNEPLAEATAEWESGNRSTYEALVTEANASNEALEKALTDSVGSSRSESKGE